MLLTSAVFSFLVPFWGFLFGGENKGNNENLTKKYFYWLGHTEHHRPYLGYRCAYTYVRCCLYLISTAILIAWSYKPTHTSVVHWNNDTRLFTQNLVFQKHACCSQTEIISFHHTLNRLCLNYLYAFGFITFLP